MLYPPLPERPIKKIYNIRPHILICEHEFNKTYISAHFKAFLSAMSAFLDPLPPPPCVSQCQHFPDPTPPFVSQCQHWPNPHPLLVAEIIFEQPLVWTANKSIQDLK